MNEGYLAGLTTTPSGKYEALVTFDSDQYQAGIQSLGAGAYVLTILDSVQNIYGISLDGNSDGAAGGDFKLAFSIPIPTPSSPVGGSDTLVNINQWGEQSGPVVATDKFGNYVTAWVSYGQDNDDSNDGNIMASLGNKAGSEFVVNSYAIGNQDSVAVSMNDDGNFVVVWYGQGSGGVTGIYARCFNNKGQATTTDFLVSAESSNTEKVPSVAMANDGSFVITWTVYDPATLESHIFAKCYDSTSAQKGSAFRVDNGASTANESADVAVAYNSGTGVVSVVIVWQNFSANNDWDIEGQRFSYTAGSIDATKVGNAFAVNSYTTDKQIDPAVAMDDRGNFIVSWSSYGKDAAGGYGVYASIFKADAAVTVPEFRVNEYTAGKQFQSDVACDPNGNFTVVWASYSQDSYGGYGIYARLYYADGTDYVQDGEVLGEFRVNATTYGNQITPAVARNSDNSDFVIVWAGPDSYDTGIYARRLAPKTTTSTTPTVSITDYASAVESAGVITYTVTLSAASTSDVVLNYYTTDGTAVGGVDYKKVTSGTLTIAAGQKTGTIFVKVFDDTVKESNETFTVTLVNASNALLGTTTATGVIIDDDSTVSTIPTLSISSASASESAGSLTFTVTLSHEYSSDVTVQYYTTGDTARPERTTPPLMESSPSPPAKRRAQLSSWLPTTICTNTTRPSRSRLPIPRTPRS